MIKIAVLGCAHGHAGMYAKVWSETDLGVKIVSVWDHEAERAAKFAKPIQAEVAGSVAAAIASADAVLIAAETNRHAELVEGAAAKGKAIVLQKPLATTLADGERIVQAVKQSKVPFTMAWQMRVDPQNMKAKELMQNGTLGKILMVRRRHGLPTQAWENFEKTWHVDPVANRDIWADDVSHAVDFMLWLLGKPQTLTAEIGSLLNPKIPNDNGIILFRYPQGTIGEVSSSFTCLAGENTLEVVGDKGVLIQNFGDLPSASSRDVANTPLSGLRWYLQSEKRWTYSEIPTPKEHGERIRGLARPLAEFLQGKRAAIATAMEGLQCLQMVAATYESNAQGKLVTLALAE
ncbi:MAG TPA: Gfo/Idh/MocA family oxidoreductase [Planctomycetota bacterium]|nr:Gfo/Idh/MocA family oxidoreductase [Planctomycetota bacterium]